MCAVTSATVSFPPVRTHGEIFDAAALSEKFRLSRESESDFVHSRLVNRASHDGIELAAAGESDRLLERRCRGVRRFGSRFAGLTTWHSAEDNVFSRISGTRPISERLDNFRSDTGAIAKCDADAFRRYSCSCA